MHLYVLLVIFFFKQKTAYEMRISDWSSDVCSSDLVRAQADSRRIGEAIGICGHRLAKGREGLKLAAVERMGGFIRAGEMAHKRFDHQPVEQAGCRLLRGKAQPVHPDRKSTRLNSSP